MPIPIISASGVQHGLIINPDGSINTVISGNITIGSVSASVDSIYVQSGNNLIGSFFPLTIIPTLNSSNPLTQFKYVYSGTSTGVTGSEIGSIIQFIEAGSYVKVLSYSDGVLTSLGSWS